MRRTILLMLLTAGAATIAVAQSEKLDYQMLGSIRDEGLNRSQVADPSRDSAMSTGRACRSPGISRRASGR